MTNRNIYDAALSLLAEEQYEDCADYEARAPYLLGAFLNECNEAGAFYRSAHGQETRGGDRDPEICPDLDSEFSLPARFAGAAAFYLAALLVEREDEAFSDRLFARYADDVTRILHDGCPGVSVSIRDVYA